MDGPHLRVVGESLSGPVESPAEKLRRLRAEIKAAAVDEIHELEIAMDHLIQVAQEVVLAEDIFPVGVRENCRGMIEDLTARSKSISMLMKRAE